MLTPLGNQVSVNITQNPTRKWQESVLYVIGMIRQEPNSRSPAREPRALAIRPLLPARGRYEWKHGIGRLLDTFVVGGQLKGGKEKNQ